MIPVLLANLRSILIGIAVVAVLGAAYTVYSKIRADAFNEARVADLEATLAASEAAALAYREAMKQDKQQADKDAEVIAKYEEQVEDLLSALEDADRECLTDNDTKRLLDAFDFFTEGGKPPTPAK
jgi:hypothetical protein